MDYVQLSELDEMIRAGYGDTPRWKIPANWSERQKTDRRGRVPMPWKTREGRKARLDAHAAEMRAKYGRKRSK